MCTFLPLCFPPLAEEMFLLLSKAHPFSEPLCNYPLCPVSSLYVIPHLQLIMLIGLREYMQNAQNSALHLVNSINVSYYHENISQLPTSLLGIVLSGVTYIKEKYFQLKGKGGI